MEEGAEPGHEGINLPNGWTASREVHFDSEPISPGVTRFIRRVGLRVDPSHEWHMEQNRFLARWAIGNDRPSLRDEGLREWYLEEVPQPNARRGVILVVTPPVPRFVETSPAEFVLAPRMPADWQAESLRIQVLGQPDS